MNAAGKFFTGIAVVSVAFALYNAISRRSVPRVFVRKKMAGNYNARTIPPFGIFVHADHANNDVLMQHEMKHWQQYQERGLLQYYFDYFSQLKKHGYDCMPMEIEARGNESEYCRMNYTECVRSGMADTIYNPDFRK